MLINEGGINWAWFTELSVLHTGGVVIQRHYRKHKGEYSEWTQAEKEATRHPEYYNSQIWKEDDKRTATEYNVPGVGWCKIVNPQYIFSYKE